MSDSSTIHANAAYVGPLFYQFFMRLHLAQRVYDPSDTVTLFLARGGIRLRRAYEEFLEVNEVAAPIEHDDFYVSRMSLIKANLARNPHVVTEDLVTEYAGAATGEFVRQFFGELTWRGWSEFVGPVLPHTPVTRDGVQHLIWGATDSAALLRRELELQEAHYRDYLDATVGSRSRVVVVDTGWSGSILHYMQTFDPDRDYTALFFGRYSYGRAVPAWYARVVGLVIEDEGCRATRPETAILANRHLIEGLCEIRVPSVTGYERDEAGRARPIGGTAPEEAVIPGPDEPQAQGVFHYIRTAPHGMNVARVEVTARLAASVLWRRLLYPQPTDVTWFSIPTRSADFGKDLDVPVLLPPHGSLPMRLANVQRSLWPPAQLALEFPRARWLVQWAYHHRRSPRTAREWVGARRRRARAALGSFPGLRATPGKAPS